MGKFLKNILLFLLPAVIAGISILIYLNTLSNDYKIEPGISTIFIGDSHIQMAINDSLLPHSLNLAAISESFYFSFYKLKMLLNNNPSVEEVYLGLSYHSLSNYYDKFISGEFSGPVAPKYFYLLPLKEKLVMINWNSNNLFPFMRRITRQGINSVFRNDRYSYSGGFSNQLDITTAVDTSMENRILSHYYCDGVLNPFSSLNIRYLDKIIGLCETEGVVLITLDTPLHEYYQENVPVEYQEKLGEIIQSRQLDHIKLSNIKLGDECFAPDGDHVSKSGADTTTIRLKEIIQERASP